MSVLKRKEAPYLLGVIVVVIWGIIIRNIVTMTRAGDDTPVTAAPPVKEKYDDFAAAPDTSRLKLNYRDPFLPVQRDTVLKTEKTVKPVAAKPVPPVNWSFIKYSGYVHNPGAKSIVALVSINNKLFMMKEGETESQVRLLRNLLDSVQVSYNGKSAFIKLKNGN